MGATTGGFGKTPNCWRDPQFLYVYTIITNETVNLQVFDDFQHVTPHNLLDLYNI